MSVLRPRRHTARKTYFIPSERDSDICEDSADERAARAERKEMADTPLAPVSNDEEYAPQGRSDSSSSSDDDFINAPKDFDPDAFVKSGRKLRWPQWHSFCDITDVGDIYTTVTMEGKTFIINTTERMKKLHQKVGSDCNSHMLKSDTTVQSSDPVPVEKRTRKQRVRSNLNAAIRFLRQHRIISLDEWNAINSAAMLFILQELYGDIAEEDIRGRMVTMTDVDSYLSTFDAISIRSPDGSRKLIEGHDLSGVEQVSNEIHITDPMYRKPPKSAPEMTQEQFEATVERLRAFLDTLRDNPDISVLPINDNQWLMNKLAPLFLEDEASVYGWTVAKVEILEPGARPSFWHMVEVRPLMQDTKLGKLILQNRREYELRM